MEVEGLEEREELLATRKAEFAHAGGVTYLDHAGATLYSSVQLDSYLSNLTTHLYGNPHSQNPSSKLSSDMIEQTRERVLNHFNTSLSHYDVVFTSGCTGALNLLVYSFPWTRQQERSLNGHSSLSHDSTVQVEKNKDLMNGSTKRSTDYVESTLDQEKNTEKSTGDVKITDERTDHVEKTQETTDHAESTKDHAESTEENADDVKSTKTNHVVNTKESTNNHPVVYLPDYSSSTTVSPVEGKQTHVNRTLHSDGSVFCYLEDNHTSVVGMREVAASRGAKIVCAMSSNLILNPKLDEVRKSQAQSDSNLTYYSASPFFKGDGHPSFSPPLHLFAYPAQSNFCGRKYPLSWVQDIPSKTLIFSGLCLTVGTWMVALDAASFVSTSPLDLSAHPAHFVAISFYKMFGFPTGLGALLVRRDCCGLLQKRYYGGGTVEATVSREEFHVPRAELHERMEDGTMSFLGIAALSHGFDTLYRVGRSMEDVSLHTFKLARYVHSSLSRLRHHNGRQVSLLYSHDDFTDRSKQGPIVNFNLVRPDGRVVGYSEVDKLACVYDIHLRTGCFCNTGACMSYLGVSTERVKEHLKAGHVCGDSMDIVNGEPTGSVRVSFGYMSTAQDARNLVHFVESCFVDPGPRHEAKSEDSSIVSAQPHNGPVKYVTLSCDKFVIKVGDRIEACSGGMDFHVVGHLTKLMLYPVKSCGGQIVTSWPMGKKGLLYDREWVIVGGTGGVVTQKQEGRLCLIQPSVDIESNTLTLSFPGCQPLTVPLEGSEQEVWRKSITTRVCQDRVSGVDCGREAEEWLTQALNRPCRLLRQDPDVQRPIKSTSSSKERGSSLSLANAAQYLLISESSVEHLCAAVEERGEKVRLTLADCVSRLRPNFVVGCESSACEGVSVPRLKPYAEEEWEEVKIGKECFKVTGPCNRCQMICVDPANGKRSPEPLKTLMELRGSKVPLGLYLSNNTKRATKLTSTVISKSFQLH